MADTRTLTELRRHWKYYVDYSSLPSGRKDRLLKEQVEISTSVAGKGNIVITPSRSAGMVWHSALLPVSELFTNYWETGTTYTLASDISSATELNPTFLYYLSGEAFNLHYGSFPQGFHLMSAFTPIAADPVGSLPETGSAAINKSKQQFKAWCLAFLNSRKANAITMRFYCGDALAFCHALNEFQSTGNPSTSIFAAQYKASQIHLDELAASTPSAPLTFDVIDTSNLIDHVSLLNLLIATPPLLKQTPASQSVIYTEALLPSGEDLTKSFLDRICTDVPTIATLFGIAPRPYISGFTPQSNIHEIVFSKMMKSQFSGNGNEMRGAQYHERVAWTNPCGGDTRATGSRTTVLFQVEDLARILYNMYDKMFLNEKLNTLASANTASKLVARSEVNFHRESVAYLFRAVQRHVCLRDGSWDQVAKRFIRMGIEAGTRLTESNNYQDLCLQLHLCGIRTLDILQPGWINYRVSPRSSLFDNWGNLPPIVCLVLTVPRRCLQLFDGDVKKIGSPTMQCCLWVKGSHESIFATIHAIWGRCNKSTSSDRFVIEEDPRGIQSPCDLVISFWASTHILEHPGTQVDLRLKTTPASTMAFAQKLGLNLQIYSTSIEDKHHVRVLAYCPTLISEPLQYPPSNETVPLPTNRLDYSCEAIVKEQTDPHVDSLCGRFVVNTPEEQEILLKGAVVSAAQISPCTMKLKIGKHAHLVLYPYPIQGSSPKLRIARKSHYVEIIVPVSKPSDTAGYFMNPLPILGTRAYTPWNIHHLNLDCLPVLDTRAPSKIQWLNTLCTLQLSDAEKVIRNGDDMQKEQAENALINFKDSIHAIAMHFSGVQGRQGRTIALCDITQGGMYAILFVGGVRLDLASMTIALDTAIVPLSEKRTNEMSSSIGHMQRLSPSPVIQIRTRGHEVIAWKRALPVFVERCRKWSHKPNCEYSAQSQIPLSVAWKEYPLCTCGEGVGLTAPQWNVPEWKTLLRFATRAAISPIFSVSYIESVAGMLDKIAPSKRVETCWACSTPGNPDLLEKAKVFELLINNGCRDITNDIDTSLCTQYPVGNGGFGDIYEGKIRDGTKAAVKCLRIFESSMDERINGNLKLASREIYAWSRCQHRNVVPLLGFTFFRGQVAMISPWMENGALPQYLQREKKVDRFGVCLQITEGLEYLHSIKMVNVLVSLEGVVKLIDFGNTETNEKFLEFTPAKITPTPRRAAPELLQEKGAYSVEADIYALGMTFLEAITNKLPFPDLRTDHAVMTKVLIKKENPSRPTSIIPDRPYANMFWNLLIACWKYNPASRPTIAFVIEELTLLASVAFAGDTRNFKSGRLGKVSDFLPLGLFDYLEAIFTLIASLHVKVKLISQVLLFRDFNQILDTLGEHNCRNLSSTIAYDRCGNIPVQGGGSSDIYQGELVDEQVIAIKCPRIVFGRLDPVVLRNTARELYIWSKCNHPNILPLLGYGHFRDRLVTITPWMPGGCLSDYIQCDPSLNRIKACREICSAVAYLHEQNVVHGDLKAANVLVSPDRSLRLIDFGHSTITDHSLQFSTPNAQMQACFWAPPEVLNGVTERSFAADVYSLAMTLLERGWIKKL
ncbi:unnamed protein product [Rhizoctonia solani]|uniref:Protein kinase domain-containing protein n=1 Tax=Rhizoctonia solani TaxID=456999 RepID=A0A8H3BAS8_9AGAM|nr:unnamed protein product [Rhizoctonia solani]